MQNSIAILIDANSASDIICWKTVMLDFFLRVAVRRLLACLVICSPIFCEYLRYDQSVFSFTLYMLTQAGFT